MILLRQRTIVLTLFMIAFLTATLAATPTDHGWTASAAAIFGGIAALLSFTRWPSGSSRTTRGVNDQQLVESLPGLVAVLDSEGCVQTTNQAYRDAFDIKDDHNNICGTPLKTVLGDEEWERVRPAFLRARTGERVTRESLMAFSSGPRHAHMIYTPLTGMDGTIRQIMLMIFDIDQHVRREERHRLTQFVMDHAGDGVLIIRENGTFIEVNRTMCSMLGYTRAEFAHLRIHDIQPGDAESGISWKKIWEDTKWVGTMRLETEQCTKSGRIVHVEILTRHITFEGLECLCAFVRDISERRHAEEQLRQNEESLRTTLHSIGDAVIATDLSGNVVRMNPPAEALTGWAIQDAHGRPLQEVFRIVNAHTHEVMDNPVDKVLATGEMVELSNDTILISRQGTQFQIADSGAPIRSEAGQTLGVVLVFRDVTNEYALQDQLRHSEKMRVIGQLSGGVAHDFNNMLMAIKGGTDLLVTQPAITHDAMSQHVLNIILNATTRAAELTSKLLAFGRKGALKFDVVNLHKIIDETTAILHRTIDRRISIAVDNAAHEFAVLGDATSLQNALLNIAINASHAMPDGGHLHVSTRNIELHESYCRANPFAIEPGTYAQIEIRDTGCGISAEDQKRMFEPFYTTKEQGTGLGLAAVYGTIQDHRGTLSVYSEVDVGTSFHLFLPCTDRPMTPPVAEVPKLPESGHVLIVDDEEGVRFICQHLLEKMGFTVWPAKTAQEALSLFRIHHAKFDLVIMDLMMPDMDGGEVFLKMKHIDPDCRVALTSGFAGNQAIEHLKAQGLLGCIPKPFGRQELATYLAEFLRHTPLPTSSMLPPRDIAHPEDGDKPWTHTYRPVPRNLAGSPKT